MVLNAQERDKQKKEKNKLKQEAEDKKRRLQEEDAGALGELETPS